MRWPATGRRRAESLRADQTEDLIRRCAADRGGRDVVSAADGGVGEAPAIGRIVNVEPQSDPSAPEAPVLALIGALHPELGETPGEAVTATHLERMSMAAGESLRALSVGRLIGSSRLGVSLSVRPWVQQARPAVRFAAALAAVLVWVVPAMAGIGALPVPAQRLAHTVAGPLGFPSPEASAGGNSGSPVGAGTASATSLDVSQASAAGPKACGTSTEVEGIRAEVVDRRVWVWVMFTGPVKGDPQAALTWVSGGRSHTTPIAMTADLPLYLGASAVSASWPSNARVSVVACGGSVRAKVDVAGT